MRADGEPPHDASRSPRIDCRPFMAATSAWFPTILLIAAIRPAQIESPANERAVAPGFPIFRRRRDRASSLLLRAHCGGGCANGRDGSETGQMVSGVANFVCAEGSGRWLTHELALWFQQDDDGCPRGRPSGRATTMCTRCRSCTPYLAPRYMARGLLQRKFVRRNGLLLGRGAEVLAEGRRDLDGRWITKVDSPVPHIRGRHARRALVTPRPS